MEWAIIEFVHLTATCADARKDRGACASGIGAKAIARQLARKTRGDPQQDREPWTSGNDSLTVALPPSQNTIRRKIVNAIGRQHDYRGAQSKVRGGQDDGG